eukprot:g3294.t1
MSDPLDLLSPEDFVSIHRWLSCVLIVSFDVDKGQVVEECFPSHVSESLTEKQKRQYAGLSLPEGAFLSWHHANAEAQRSRDCNVIEEDLELFYTWRSSKLFATNRSSSSVVKPKSNPNSSASKVDKTKSTSNSMKSKPNPVKSERKAFEYGYVYFKRSPSDNIKRGYLQRSLVLISPLPILHLFEKVATVLADTYFNLGLGSNAIKAMFLDIGKWPPPRPFLSCDLPVLGCAIHCNIPPNHAYKNYLYHRSATDLSTRDVYKLARQRNSLARKHKQLITSSGRETMKRQLSADVSQLKNPSSSNRNTNDQVDESTTKAGPNNPEATDKQTEATNKQTEVTNEPTEVKATEKGSATSEKTKAPKCTMPKQNGAPTTKLVKPSRSVSLDSAETNAASAIQSGHHPGRSRRRKRLHRRSLSAGSKEMMLVEIERKSIDNNQSGHQANDNLVDNNGDANDVRDDSLGSSGPSDSATSLPVKCTTISSASNDQTDTSSNQTETSASSSSSSSSHTNAPVSSTSLPPSPIPNKSNNRLIVRRGISDDGTRSLARSLSPKKQNAYRHNESALSLTVNMSLEELNDQSYQTEQHKMHARDGTGTYKSSSPSRSKTNLHKECGLFQHLNLFSIFGTSFAANIWYLWECMLLGRPILVVSPSPATASQVIMALVSLISPLSYAGDFRPYINVFDQDFAGIQFKHDQGKGLNLSSHYSTLCLGSSNPYMAKFLKNWPVFLSIMPTVNGMSVKLNSTNGCLEPTHRVDTFKTLMSKTTSSSTFYTKLAAKTSTLRLGKDLSVKFSSQLETNTPFLAMRSAPIVSSNREIMKQLVKIDLEKIQSRNISQNSSTTKDKDVSDVERLGQKLNVCNGVFRSNRPPAETLNNAILRKHFKVLTSQFLYPFERYFQIGKTNVLGGPSIHGPYDDVTKLLEDFDEQEFDPNETVDNSLTALDGVNETKHQMTPAPLPSATLDSHSELFQSANFKSVSQSYGFEASRRFYKEFGPALYNGGRNPVNDERIYLNGKKTNSSGPPSRGIPLVQVKSFASSSVALAHSYTASILGFLTDLIEQGHFNPTQPLIILELGGGSGKLAFRVLSELKKNILQYPRIVNAVRDVGTLKASSSPKANEHLKGSDQKTLEILSKVVRYCLTDYAFDASATFWANHPSLKPFLEAGVLHLGKLDARELKKETRLLFYGDSFHNNNNNNNPHTNCTFTLDRHSLRNPLVVLANNSLNSLGSDLFHLRLGIGDKKSLSPSLFEIKVSTEWKRKRNQQSSIEENEEFPSSSYIPNFMEDLEQNIKMEPLRSAICKKEERYYSEEMNAVLKAYVEFWKQKLIVKRRELNLDNDDGQVLQGGQNVKNEKKIMDTSVTFPFPVDALKLLIGLREFTGDRLMWFVADHLLCKSEEMLTVEVIDESEIEHVTNNDFSEKKKKKQAKGGCQHECCQEPNGDESSGKGKGAGGFEEKEIEKKKRTPFYLTKTYMHRQFLKHDLVYAGGFLSACQVNFHALEFYLNDYFQAGFTLTPLSENDDLMNNQFRCVALSTLWHARVPFHNDQESIGDEFRSSMKGEFGIPADILRPEMRQRMVKSRGPLLTHFSLAWNEYMVNFTPTSSGLLAVQQAIKMSTNHPFFSIIQNLLRTSRYDSSIFFTYRSNFLKEVPYLADKEQRCVKVELEKVYQTYYPLDVNVDIAFEIGRIMMGLRDYARARDLFLDSLRYCGEHHVTFYNHGICCAYVGLYREALQR